MTSSKQRQGRDVARLGMAIPPQVGPSSARGAGAAPVPWLSHPNLSSGRNSAEQNAAQQSLQTLQQPRAFHHALRTRITTLPLGQPLTEPAVQVLPDRGDDHGIGM